MVNVDGRTDGWTDRRTNKRTETCTPKSPMLKQVRQKVTKINTKIILKPHAHLKIMEEMCVKFQKDQYKTVWRVALTKYPLSIHFHRIWGQKMTKWKKWQKLMQGLYPNHMHIFRPWRKHVQNFKKIGIKLYEELRSQGTHCLYIEVENN